MSKSKLMCYLAIWAALNAVSNLFLGVTYTRNDLGLIFTSGVLYFALGNLFYLRRKEIGTYVFMTGSAFQISKMAILVLVPQSEITPISMLIGATLFAVLALIGLILPKQKARKAKVAQPLRLTLINSLLSASWVCGLFSAIATVISIIPALLFGFSDITVTIGTAGFITIVATNIYFIVGHVLVQPPYEVKSKSWLRFRAIESPGVEHAEKPKRNPQRLVGDDGELVDFQEHEALKNRYGRGGGVE